MNIAITDDLQRDREKIIHILSEYAASAHIDLSISEYNSAEEFISGVVIPIK